MVAISQYQVQLQVTKVNERLDRPQIIPIIPTKKTKRSVDEAQSCGDSSHEVFFFNHPRSGKANGHMPDDVYCGHSSIITNSARLFRKTLIFQMRYQRKGVGR